MKIRSSGPCTFVALAAWLSMPSAASGCDVLLEQEHSPLEIRKPVRGDDARLTAGFGLRRHPILNLQRMHTGVDWGAPLGTPVVAAARGRVDSAEREGEYGNRVIIDHGGGWQTLYGQLESFAVRQGDCVEGGTLIGKVGASGLAIGPHLHFEVRHRGRHLDPMAVPTRPQGGSDGNRP